MTMKAPGRGARARSSSQLCAGCLPIRKRRRKCYTPTRPGYSKSSDASRQRRCRLEFVEILKLAGAVAETLGGNIDTIEQREVQVGHRSSLRVLNVPPRLEPAIAAS